MDLATGECSVTFGTETHVLQTDEEGVSGAQLEFDSPVTIYIGKDFENSFFYNPIYDFAYGV